MRKRRKPVDFVETNHIVYNNISYSFGDIIIKKNDELIGKISNILYNRINIINGLTENDYIFYVNDNIFFLNEIKNN